MAHMLGQETQSAMPGQEGVVPFPARASDGTLRTFDTVAVLMVPTKARDPVTWLPEECPKDELGVDVVVLMATLTSSCPGLAVLDIVSRVAVCV